MRKYISLDSFSKQETNLLKGLAIIFIAFHNYTKWIPLHTGENEFGFRIENWYKTFSYISNNPFSVVQYLSSFIGHYGVQIFIFISAYGLSKSWHKKSPTYIKFILQRLNKLYPAFILAVLAYILFIWVVDHKLVSKDTLGDIAIQLSLFANFIPGKAFAVSGPWWFYSLIFQLYLIFPLLYVAFKKWGNKTLLIAAGLSLAAIYFKRQEFYWLTHLKLMQLFIGHIPEFALGIYFASKQKIRIPLWLYLISFFVVALGNVYVQLWPFTYISVTLFSLVSFKLITKYLQENTLIYKLLFFIGSVSMYIFAIQGFLRNPFIGLAGKIDTPLGTILIGFMFISVASILGYALMYLEQRLRQWVNQNDSSKQKAVRLTAILILIIGPMLYLFETNKKNNISINKLNASPFQTIQSMQIDLENITASDVTELSPILYANRQSIVINNTSSALRAELPFSNEAQLIPLQLIIRGDLYVTESKGRSRIALSIYDNYLNQRIYKKFHEIEFEINQWNPFSKQWYIPSALRSDRYTAKVSIHNDGKNPVYLSNESYELRGKTRP